VKKSKDRTNRNAISLGSAGAGSSAFVGPMPTDPVEFRKCARDLEPLRAAKEHTNEERGGGRDPGVRRPGTGRGQLPTRSKIFRAAALIFVFVYFPLFRFFFWEFINGECGLRWMCCWGTVAYYVECTNVVKKWYGSDSVNLGYQGRRGWFFKLT